VSTLNMKKLDAEKVVELIKPVTDEEIKDALFSIDVNKASGPDGYTLKFFKAAWSVVGKDTCSAIKEFFDIELKRGMSWSWKHLLVLRDKIKAFVRVRIGNGKDCSIWYDKWHPKVL
nr:hypothetical protein [Tanacetum cinerariifolium]